MTRLRRKIERDPEIPALSPDRARHRLCPQARLIASGDDRLPLAFPAARRTPRRQPSPLVQARAAALALGPLAAHHRDAAGDAASDRDLVLLRPASGTRSCAGSRPPSPATSASRSTAMSIRRRRAERDRAPRSARGDVTELGLSASAQGEKLPAGLQRTTGGGTEEQLAQAMVERVDRPFQIDGEFDPRDILVSVEMPNGVMQVAVPRKRLSTPTTYALHPLDGRLVAGAADHRLGLHAQPGEVAAPACRRRRCVRQGPRRAEFQARGRDRSAPGGARLHQDARAPAAPDHASAPRCWPACRTICARR